MFNIKCTNLFSVFAVRLLAVLFGLGLFTNLSFGQTSTGNGNWNANSNPPWSTSTAPSAATATSIGNTITLNIAAPTTGSLAGNGIVTASIGATLTLGALNTNTTFSGVINNAGSAIALTKTGTGTLILSGNNSYTGATNVSGNGVLNIQNNNALGGTGAGTTVASGSALEIQGNITVGAEAMSLTGTGIGTNGALRNINSTNTYGGTITLGGATTIQSDAGTLTLSAANAITGAAQNLTIEGAGNGVISGTITTTSGTVTKNDAGNWTLSGANTYTGITTINAGVLNIQNNNALGGTGAGTTVASSSALEIQGNITIGAEALSLTGTGIGTNGALRNVGGNNTYGGTITLGGATTIESDGGTLTLSAANAITGAAQNLTIEGAGNGVISGTITTTSGTVTKNNAGDWTLSGANTYTGTTTINAGTISVANATGLGTTAGATVVNSGGTLDINGVSVAENISIAGTGDGGVGALTGIGTGSMSGTVAMTAASTIGGAGTLNVSGVVSGAFALTKDGAGSLILSGVNTYTGNTILTGGTVRVNADVAASTNGPLGNNAGAVQLNGGDLQVNSTNFTRALSVTANGSAIDAFGAARTVSGAISGAGFTLQVGGTTAAAAEGQNLTLSGVISSTLGLTKIGTSTTTLSGANTYTGVTTINAGILSVGTIGNGGAASSNLGSATNAASNLVLGGGTLEYTGGTSSTNRNFTLTAGTTSSIDVNSAAATLTISGSSTATTGGLTKTGAGTLVLSGTNLHTGPTTVSEGTLKLSSSTTLSASSAITVSAGATLDLTALASPVTIGSISGPGTVLYPAGGLIIGDNTNSSYGGDIPATITTLTKVGTGTVTLSGTNLYTGVTNVNAGTLSVTNADGLGTVGSNTVVAAGATLDIADGVTVAEPVSIGGTGVGGLGTLTSSGTGTLSGTVAMTANSTVGGSGVGTLTLSGVISGAFDLTKNGTTTTVLSGVNTYPGAVTINNGTLSVSSIANAGTNSALGTGSTTPAIAIASTGTLQYIGNGHSSSRVINLTGSGASVDASGTGAMTLTGGITGNTRNLILTGSGNGVESGVIATTSGSVTKTGSGTWSLTGANTYTGGTVISDGILSLGAANVLANGGKVTLNGGTLGTLTFAETMGTLDLEDISSIELGPSSTLNFAASNGETWAAGKKLTINGWKGTYTTVNPVTSSATGSEIFVGSLATHLTAGQVAQIQFFNAGNYYPAKILATGEIVPNCIVAVTSASYSSVTSAVANNVNYNITGGTTYTWSRAAVTGISNTASTNQTSDPIVETLTNTTTSAINVTYVITTAAGGGCASGTFEYVVSVNPVNSVACSSVPASPPQPACATLSNLNTPGATTLVTGTSYGFCGTSYSTGNVDGGVSNAPIYVLSGQTLTIGGNVNTASNIYVFAGATLNLTGDFNTTGSNLYVYGTLNHAVSGTSKVQGSPSTIYIAPGGVYNGGDLQMNGSGTIINEGTMILKKLDQFQGSAKMCVHNSGCVSTAAILTVNATNIITFGGSLGYFYYSGTTCPTPNNALSSSTDMRICAAISVADAAASSGGNCNGKFGSATVTYGCRPSSNNCPGAIALPITLTFFKPTLTNEGVIIRWGTNSQWHSDYFVIEKSQNGIDWEYVNSLPSDNGKYRYKEFSITDPNPYEGDSYYRLVEVDKDGKRKVYATDFIHNDKTFAGFSIYPNPSNGSFIVAISGDSPRYQMSVFDVLGKNLGVYTLSAGKNEINTADRKSVV